MDHLKDVLMSLLSGESKIGLQLLTLGVMIILTLLGVSIKLNMRLANRMAEHKDIANGQMHAAHTASIQALQAADAQLCQSINDMRTVQVSRAEVSEMFKEVKHTLELINATMIAVKEELGKKVDLTTCVAMQQKPIHGP